MKFYLNQCYTGQSIERDDSQECETQKEIMPKTNHNNNNNNNISNNSTSKFFLNKTSKSRGRKFHKQHEIFDLQHDYRANEGLTIEYRENLRETSNYNRKILLRCIVTAFVLLIITGIVTYVAIYGINKEKKKSRDEIFSRNTESIKKPNRENSAENKNISENTNNSINNTCMTSACYKIAESIKRSMNTSVDPCDDFYEYSCGRWPQHYKLKDSMHKLDVMSELTTNKNLFLKRILEQEVSMTGGANLNGFEQKLVRIYKSCLNTDKIEQKGKTPLLNFIDTFGKWSPINRGERELTSLDVNDVLIRSHQFFSASVYTDLLHSPLFRSGVKSNDKNPKEHLFEISVPELPLPMPTMYLIENSQLQAIRRKYRLLLTNYVALLGPARDAKETIENILEFETKIASLIIAAPAHSNQTTIKDFIRLVGNELNWLKIFKSYFASVNKELKEDTLIGVTSIEFFQSLDKLLGKTSKQLIIDYIIWICVWKYGLYASSPFREADHNFQQAILGIQARPVRWMRCIEDLEQTMEFGLASLYVREVLTDEDRNLVKELATNIQKEFKRNLVNVEWMDVATKAEAFEKVELMIQGIGYPPFVLNTSIVDILYGELHVSEEEYFENIITMYKTKRLSNLMLLDKMVDRSSYDLPPTLTEAYFDPNKNKMVLLAGILQPPFFGSTRLQALNYGALGLVVGHEITHAFDTRGRHFDSKGVRQDWWSEKSADAFHEKINCMKEQYSNYSVYGIPIDGEYTLSENVGDCSGIKMAYKAYKEWERENGPEKTLPGLSLTPDQLLFVSHGQIWCGIYREEYMKNIALKSDRHSPSKYRVIGPLSNLQEFSDAFKCPIGSTMNPKNKCEIW